MQEINEDSSLVDTSFSQEVMASVANFMPSSVYQDDIFDSCCFIEMTSGCVEGMFAGRVDLIDRSSRIQLLTMVVMTCYDKSLNSIMVPSLFPTF